MKLHGTLSELAIAYSSSKGYIAVVMQTLRQLGARIEKKGSNHDWHVDHGLNY
jgi:hypothetical protein